MQPDVTTATLHVGFVGLIETDAELEILRRPEKTTDRKPGPARSRIGKTVEMIAPIDRVAARVVPDPAPG
jgi:hypothetical protein